VIAIISGLVAGAAHVLSGPDHLAAVAPLSVRPNEAPWRIGLRWGLGHSAGVIVIGLLSLLLRELLPHELLSSWAERVVGIILIAIGIWGLRKAFRRHVHTHQHTHDGATHDHIHLHAHSHAHHPAAPAPTEHRHTHAAFAVGTLHGLAGSSHFLGILPALAFTRQVDAVSYLIAFGIGTVVSMAAFSSVIGLISQRLSFSGPRAYQTAMATCSIAALVVGVYWLTA
jgi:ABC-type nickel/cobalt efflux system permease component RcnA